MLELQQADPAIGSSLPTLRNHPDMMHLVTLRHDPLGLWVDKHPVFIPPLDSILVSALEAYDLANEWSTDVMFLDKSQEYDYLVFLPDDLYATVRWSGKRLGLC